MTGFACKSVGSKAENLIGMRLHPTAKVMILTSRVFGKLFFYGLNVDILSKRVDRVKFFPTFALRGEADIRL